METDFGFQTRAYYCFLEWLTTYSNLNECAQMLHNNGRSEASLVETSYWWNGDYSA